MTKKLDSSQEKFLLVTTLFGIIAPIIAVDVPHFFFSAQSLGLLICASICSVVSVLNFFILLNRGRYSAGAKVLSVNFVGCYSLGLYFSHGLHSSVLYYGPLICLVSGFLVGKKGAVLSTVVLFTAISLAFVLERTGYILPPPQPISPFQFWLQVASNLIFVGTLTFLFVELSQKKEVRLEVLNNSLEHEKQLLAAQETMLNEAQQIARIGSWTFDLLTQEQVWSKQHYRIFEIAPPKSSDMLYQVYRNKIHPDDLPALDAHIDKARLKGEGFVYDHRVLLTDGTIRYVQGIGNVKKDKNGKPILLTGTCQDVTERTLRERELQLLLDENQAIHRSAQFSIITFNLKGVVTRFNKESERILGYSAREVIGISTFAQFLDPHEITSVANDLPRDLGRELAQGPKILEYLAEAGTDAKQLSYIRKDGNSVQVKLSLSLLKNAEDHVYGYMGIAEDISEQVRVTEALEFERLKSLRNAKLASLGEMSAGIAHEINNPLAIISGNIRLLNKFTSNPLKFQEKIEAMERAIGRITKIVMGLRKFSRSGNRTELKPKSLREIIQETLVLVDAKSRRHATPIVVKCDSEALIHCDEIEIEQILINLINNGIDAVKSESEKWVQVNVLENGNTVILRVRNSGSRISSQVETKLFQPFFTTKPVGQGTGLGLSIVKGILDEHKASIELLKDDPHTCFEVRFQSVEALKNAA